MNRLRELFHNNAFRLILALLMHGVMYPQSKIAAASAARVSKEATQPGGYYRPQPTLEALDLYMYERIRTEGMTHGKAMAFASALADGIGPRLTGSPNMKKANDWTRDTLAKIGLENAHLEDWGEFGMGWYQINAWGRIVTPDPEPIWMQAAVWSAATKGPVTGEILYLPLRDNTELDAAKGTFKGKIVLLGEAPSLTELDQPLSFRYKDEELRVLEGPGTPRRLTGPPPVDAASRIERRRVAVLRQRAVEMMRDEGAVAVLLPSHEEGRNVRTGLLLDDNGVELSREAQLRRNAVPIPYAVVMTEHYNRLARLAQAHVPLRVELNIQTAFTGDHEHGFNTIAEIPGADPKLKNEVVMVGGHLDSWPAGTGATDNGAGAVIAMEAVRILRALNVKPKRTIRIALWSGEEQGEFGSKGYVAEHFGGFAPSSPPGASGSLITKKEWDQLDAYYNFDEGGGKIRGIYTQGNYQVEGIFSQWIAPLADLGVTSVTNRNDPGSDHESFDDIGLPGFNFLQDEMDYETRTHHSNLDTVDHLRAADLEQAAVVEAIFLWNTSEREAIMPRKPFPHPEDDQRMKAPIPGLFPNATPGGH
ncbi:M20/M25/M40 family metallo-hydrolase [Acidisarcina polymorpha]|nr:M20/M25/M40 family metallo-hydrolase [Acidisarcina polymorpha]